MGSPKKDVSGIKGIQIALLVSHQERAVVIERLGHPLDIFAVILDPDLASQGGQVPLFRLWD